MYSLWTLCGKVPYTSSNDGCNELFIPLDWLMIWCLISSFLLGLGGISVYVYYLRQGQFEDLEDVKYQMFRDEEINESKEE
jgi:nitrogen fixation-related uncharacterized protein